MIKTETKTVEVKTWVFSDDDKKELIEVMPKLLSKAFSEGYNSIQDLFNSMENNEDIIINLLQDYVDFIKNEIDYIDVYDDDSDDDDDEEDYEDDDYYEDRNYVGDEIIDFITNYERMHFVKPDYVMLASNYDNMHAYFENRDLASALIDYLKEKPALFEEIVDFFRNY